MKKLEHHIQCAVVRWARVMEYKYPQLKMLYAIPNGGHRDIRVAVALKAEGVRPGVPDLCLPWANKFFHGLYIEMKAPKGIVSPAQNDFLDGLANNGYATEVCYSTDEAIETTEDYLNDKTFACYSTEETMKSKVSSMR